MTMEGHGGSPGWAVVIPVKSLPTAKTRLRGVMPQHEWLVLALAQDTVRAARACPVVTEVLVVTDDATTTAALAELGARVVPDAPGAGLNAAVTYGATEATAGWVAAIAADLPALRPRELAVALRTAVNGGGRGFVPDAASTGTTLLAAPPGIRLDPQFGWASATRHAASGARQLAGDWPSLRRDVDTPADLAEAEQLGLGPHTSGLLRRLGGGLPSLSADV